jgi:CRISPR-associated protein Csb2
MLAIEVEYLSGRATATDYGERSAPEWPPHPQRLFSALVASYADTAMKPEAERALRWLEQQDPPSLQVDLDPGQRQSLSFWVPINDETLSSKDLNLQHIVDRRGKQERYFPSVIPGDPLVTYLWQNDPEPDVRAALVQLVGDLSYLGHSSSLVRACVRSEPVEPTLVPAELGEYELRVPGPGRFDRLAQVHELRLTDETIQPPLGKLQRYAEESRLLPRGDFRHAVTMKFEDGRRFGLAQMAGVTDRMRRALLQTLPDKLPEVLSGHSADGKPSLLPHLAIVPLAFVGSEHAKGDLKGLALLMPKSATSDAIAMLDDALHELQQLHFGRLGSLTLQRVDQPRDELKSLDFSAYQRPATHWKSVTPVILDRYPKAKLSAEQIIADSLTRQGLPTPVSIELRRQSLVAGSDPSAAFNLPEAHKNKLRFHVRMGFARKIRGPLLLGAGRFQGFGLFLPELKL